MPQPPSISFQLPAVSLQTYPVLLFNTAPTHMVFDGQRGPLFPFYYWESWLGPTCAIFCQKRGTTFFNGRLDQLEESFCLF